MGRKAYIVGLGLTQFLKPRGKVTFDELGLEAAVKALLDAGINYDEVEQAYCAFNYLGSGCGQKTLYQLGMTGIPIFNMNNACASGSTAFFCARSAVESGVVECAMALGFETMAPGPIVSPFKHEPSIQHTFDIIAETRGGSGTPNGIIFGNGAQEYIEKYGATIEDLAKITSKAHTHASKNPYSQFRNLMTPEDVLNDKKTTNLLTRSMCCPTSDGGACVIVASEDFVHKHGLEGQAIEIVAQALTTDDPMLYDTKSAIELTGANMTRRAAKEALSKAGITVDNLGIIELHDCFAANELLVYDGLGLCEPGHAQDIVRNGDNTFGGKWVINPSGGLLCKGHPLGATGIGMLFYVAAELRGICGPIQVPAAAPGGDKPYGLAHNLGLGGICSVTILTRPSWFEAGADDGRKRLGYNFGCEARGITPSDVEKVRSKKLFSKRGSSLSSWKLKRKQEKAVL